MRNPFEFYAGLRYLRAKRRNHFISFISAASMICIALGVGALITVMSVMNGFEQELRLRILSNAAHASILGGDSGLADWAAVAAQASKNPEVAGAAPFIDGEAMVKVGSDLSGTSLHGILPEEEARVSDIGRHMKDGSLDDLKPGEFGIVLGVELAQTVGVSVGDSIDLMTLQADSSAYGLLPRLRRFTVKGVFQTGTHDFDAKLALVNLQDAASLYGMEGRVSGVRLKLRDMFEAPRVMSELASQLKGDFHFSDWTQEHASFFKAVATEKMSMFVILSMIVLIAAFQIVATLVMVVTEKRSDIAILRTLGAAPRSIIAIFMLQGSLIGIIGTIGGVVLGVTLASNTPFLTTFLRVVTGGQFLNPDIYYISDLPSDLQMHDVVRITLMSLALGIVSTLYPAWHASRIQPAEALRYE